MRLGIEEAGRETTRLPTFGLSKQILIWPEMGQHKTKVSLLNGRPYSY